MEGLCRVCASDQHPLTYIVNDMFIKIKVCLRLEVLEGDELPKTLCNTCADLLDASYELVQRCARGQQELQTRLTLIKNVDQAGHEESDSDSSSFYQLQPLELCPQVIESSPTCRHSISSSVDGECEACGGLEVLAAAVASLRGFESSTATSSSSIDIPSSSSNLLCSTSRVEAPSCNNLPCSQCQSIHQPRKCDTTTIDTPASTSNLASSPQRRKLSCDFCGKVFHHTGDLNKHRRCHTGERPYSCTQCDRKFAHVSNLLRHRKLHSGERPFSCSKCQRKFSRSDKLISHNCAAKPQQ